MDNGQALKELMEEARKYAEFTMHNFGSSNDWADKEKFLAEALVKIKARFGEQS